MRRDLADLCVVPLLFVFDMDDVLYSYDWRTRMEALGRRTGLDLLELRRRWWNTGGEMRAEAGAWTRGADYLAAVSSAIGTELDADDFIAIRRSAMTPRPDVLAVVRRAGELGRVSLLTNNGILVHERLADLAPELVPLFGEENLRASASYGARKPDPAVFRAMLAAYDADPADVFFADDLAENVAGAESVGITAHLYRDAEGLRAAVEEFAAARIAA
jgi:glucose-1-phosphatase